MVQFFNHQPDTHDVQLYQRPPRNFASLGSHHPQRLHGSSGGHRRLHRQVAWPGNGRQGSRPGPQKPGVSGKKCHKTPGDSVYHSYLMWFSIVYHSNNDNYIFFIYIYIYGSYHVGKCHLQHPPVITVFIGGMAKPFPVMAGLWHCFTHKWLVSKNFQAMFLGKARVFIGFPHLSKYV